MLVDLRERPLPDEVVLVELDDPGHVRAQRVGLRIGVLPDDDVLLFEPEDPLCFETERLRAKIGAALEQRVPEVLGADAREVELVAELADESDPERQTRHAGNRCLPRVEVLEPFRRNVRARQPP